MLDDNILVQEKMWRAEKHMSSLENTNVSILLEESGSGKLPQHLCS